ncbi:hypothetical protein ABZS88_02085 [Streptomyces sp. NPDC005480]
MSRTYDVFGLRERATEFVPVVGEIVADCALTVPPRIPSTSSTPAA